jgi:hypothetical protein
MAVGVPDLWDGCAEAFDHHIPFWKPGLHGLQFMQRSWILVPKAQLGLATKSVNG